MSDRLRDAAPGSEQALGFGVGLLPVFLARVVSKRVAVALWRERDTEPVRTGEMRDTA